MKFDHNKNYTTIAIYALIVISISMFVYHAMQGIGGVFSFIGNVIGYLTPVVYGVVFAFLLNPLLRTVEHKLLDRLPGKKKLKPSARRLLGLLITYIIFGVCIAAFIAIVIPQLYSSLTNIIGNFTKYISTMSALINNLNIWLNDFLISIAGNESGSFAAELSTAIQNSFSSIIRTTIRILEQSASTISSFTIGVLNLVLGVIVSVYILTEREKLFAQLRKIAHALFNRDTYNLLYDISMDISRIFSGFVVGKVIDSLIIGVLCFICMAFFRFPYPMLISVIVGITNVIPYFGPIIGAVPGFIIILIVDPVRALWFLVFIIALQQLDGNVIGPKILGETIGLSPLWIILSIMLFSGLLGVLGMFIGVPLFAILYSLVRRLVNYLLLKKGESTDTRDYDSGSNPLIK